jgi:preprotein translocase subunit SecD
MWIFIPIGIVLFLAFDFVIASLILGKGFFSPKSDIVFEPDTSRVSMINQADLTITADILQQRWNTLGNKQFGVSFKVSEDNQIIGRLPKDLDPATLNNLKKVGLVEFVDFGKTFVPVGTVVNTDLNPVSFQTVDGQTWHTLMTNSEMNSVYTQTGSDGKFEISFQLSESGKKIFADFTSQNVGSYVGILVDKVVISCPFVNSPILDGQGVISGSFTQEEAQNLVSLLKTSPLPIPLK